MSQEWKLVLVDQLKKWHRDLDACQKVIWLSGGFDPAYCKDAQACLQEMEAVLETSAQPGEDEPVAVMYEDGAVLTVNDCLDREVFEIICRRNTPLYLHPRREVVMAVQQALIPASAVLPHPPRHEGFLQPEREVPGYTIEQMKEYGAQCVAAFIKQNSMQR